MTAFPSQMQLCGKKKGWISAFQEQLHQFHDIWWKSSYFLGQVLPHCELVEVGTADQRAVVPVLWVSPSYRPASRHSWTFSRSSMLMGVTSWKEVEGAAASLACRYS